MNKMTVKHGIKEFILINLALFLQAAGIYFFVIQNGFSIGGVSGLAVLISGAFSGVEGFPSTATIIAILNAVLLVLGFAFLGKGFGIKTVYGSVAFSAFTWLFERFIPLKTTLTGDTFLELIVAILMSAVGAAILFHYSASSGGTDIIAMILQKRCRIDLGAAFLVTNLVIAVSSFFVISVRIGIFSVLGLFLKSFVVDGAIESIDLCKYFNIITEKPDEICAYILENMHRGVTKCDVIGAYSGAPKELLLTVCKRSEADALKKKIKEIDPGAFIMITNSSEIVGKGFQSGV